MRISVFGASGFIGRHLRSLSSNYVAEDRDSLVPTHRNVVFLVSTTHNYHINTNPFIDIETNQIHTLRVLENLRAQHGNLGIFNFISTWFVYGMTPCSPTSPLTEDSPCDPRGFYSITRHAAERLVASYCNHYGIRYRILRLGNIIGVGDKKASLRKNAIVHLLQQSTTGEIVMIYDKSSFRDLMDVRDCVSAIDLVIHSGRMDEIYNICNGHSVDIKNLLEENIPSSRLRHMPVPDFHKSVQTQNIFLSNQKLRDLGYTRNYSLEETVDWIKNENRID